MSEIDPTRLDRLDDVRAERGLEAVWFARPGGFAWLTGADNVVDRDADVGVAAAGYDGHRVTVVTSNIEAPRLRAESLPANVDVVTYDWHQLSLLEAIAEQSAGATAAADVDVTGFERLDVSSLRQPLSERDCSRYRDLGEAVAESVEDVARSFERGATERSIAARVRRRLAEDGIRAPVVLVGDAERASQYRHFTPTEATVDRYALISVTAERGGLFVSCTRAVAFDPPAWLGERLDAVARVEATALAATQSAAQTGGTAGDVFAAVQDAYAALGFDDEWRHHHQGGAAGFAGREWIATPGGDERVHAPMAYAWNPTVRGAKSEDTVLVTDEAFDVLSTTGQWPTRRVSAVGEPVELERHDVLER